MLCTHRGIVNRLLAMQETYRIDESDRLLQKTQSSFDVSVREVFWPLIFGARIVVAQPGEHGNPLYLAALVEREQVTTLHFVPSMLQVFLEQADPAQVPQRALRSLRRRGAAGRPRAQLPRAFRCELHNLYGPTEAAVSVTAYRVDGDEQSAIVPIGRPVANTQVYLLDERLEPVPSRVWGELFIGGVQVARGYHNRPELTAERFVANPFGEGRLYRTGDLGRWNSAGAIEFGGRIDDQVKVRGFRIEPGEIEAVLREHESVVESAVAVFDEELAAYVVLDPSASASSSDLLAFLRGKLPEYMVPGSVTPLEELPLLPSGKLDRAALPVPEKQRATEEFVAGQTEGEQAVAAMWGDLLGVERVGRNDNFFALGGHSLLAARMIGRVAKELGVELPLCSFLQEPTVAALALEIESARAARPRPARACPPLVRRSGIRGCSFAQERFWFVDQVMGKSAAYNIPVGSGCAESFASPLLERALGEIVRRHEILRTHFSIHEGRPVQLVEPTPALSRFPCSISSALPTTSGKGRRSASSTRRRRPRSSRHAGRCSLRSSCGSAIAITFSISFSATWSSTGCRRSSSCGSSIRLYGALVGGELPALPEPSVQFADFAEWQRSWLEGEILEQELAYWTDALAGMPAALELPTDHRGPRSRVLRVPGRSRPCRSAPSKDSGCSREARARAFT